MKKISGSILIPLVLLVGFPGARECDGEDSGIRNDVPEGMALIPGGTALIGTEVDELGELAELGADVPHMNEAHAAYWFGDETPRHRVDVAPFYMDVYEVTNSMFAEFVKSTGYEARGDWEAYAGEGMEDHPVVGVTWNDANAYAEWAGKRLPSETEWEYAARGGTRFRWYPWGDLPNDSLANWRHEGETFIDGVGRVLLGREIRTTPVGSFPPNGFGLHDMVGNAAEWCADVYEPYPGFSLDVPCFDENGSEGTVLRVVRGGSWDSPNPVFVRITGRESRPEDHSSYRVGFRCAMDAPQTGSR